MIYQKRGMWKSTYLAQKFHSYEDAEKAEAEHLHLPEPVPPPPLPPEDGLTPLERLRGHKICEECNCDPCECEWKSVEETSSETESSTEDLS